MRQLLPLLLTLTLGCGTTPKAADPVPVSAVRTSLLGRTEWLLRKSLATEGFTLDRVEVKSDGTVARNSGEQWDENVVRFTFDAAKPPDPAAVLTVRQQAAVLGNVRDDLRKLVTGQDGEVLDVSETESYRERTLTLAYKLAGVVGTVTARLRPATDVPEETRNRLDVTVREQPGK